MHVTYCFLWENRSYHKFSIMHITLFCLFISHTIILLCTFLILSDLYTRYWQKWILITIYRSESFPLRVTGWPVELMAYAFLVVSPPDMSQRFEEVRSCYSALNVEKIISRARARRMVNVSNRDCREIMDWIDRTELTCMTQGLAKFFITRRYDGS